MIPTLLALALTGLPAALPASAAVRTRDLPPAALEAEASLTARARAAERVHAIVRVPASQLETARAGGVRLLRAVDGELWLASIPAATLARGRLPHCTPSSRATSHLIGRIWQAPRMIEHQRVSG